MPGTPLKRAMLAAIADYGGLEAILDRVANGDTVIQIALDLKVGRDMLSTWLLGEPERRAAYHRAKARSAAALAEQSLHIADGALDPQKARLQIDTRRWLAGIYDREQFGEQKQSAVQVNIGSLHIDAMRHVQAELSEGPIIDVKPVESGT